MRSCVQTEPERRRGPRPLRASPPFRSATRSPHPRLVQLVAGFARGMWYEQTGFEDNTTNLMANVTKYLKSEIV